MLQHSFKKRYFYKVVANLVAALAGFLTQMVIPRGLGAVQYGNFNFLTDFFTQFLGFLNMGSSIGFYTKLSRRPHEPKMVGFYLYFMAFAGLITFGFIMLVQGIHIDMKLWPGQTLKYVYLAALLGVLTWLMSSVNDMTDAYGLTVPAELAKIGQRFVGLLLIFCMFRWGWVNMDTVFYFNYVIIFVFILLFLRIMERNGFPSLEGWRLKIGEIKSYFREFYSYSQPLFLYALVGLLIGVFDRWFLQWCGGGIQQGFYSLSFRIGAICLLLTGAMTQLMTREFSLAFHNKDFDLMRRLFRRYIPLLYAVTASISCFLAINAGKVSLIMGGKEFKSAVLPVAIMSLYPIHQTYGQLSNSLFFATDQTRLYRNIAVIFMLIGVPATYFLVGTPQMGGLNTGATGLALKMVVLNVLMVNVHLYFNMRFLKLPLGWYLRHQIITVAGFLFLAYGASRAADVFVVAGFHPVLRVLVAGLFYGLALLVTLYFLPGIFGLNREILKSFWQSGWQKVRLRA